MTYVKPIPPGRRYIGSTKLAERYDRSLRTVQRWLVEPPPGFPAPIKHNGRWLWSVEDLDSYDRTLITSMGRAA